MDSLPTPPMEDQIKSHSGPKKHSTSSKSVKTVHRTGSAKRTSTTHGHTHPPSPTQDHMMSADGRHKRVWKACERCRMKKTKCDGEFPCKRCKDDGLVCTAGTRKKTEYKQLPRGYAEVLENTQFALIATVHKLYSMVRNGQAWDLGEPELNDRGQPVIHNIASKLGCIRPNSDMDLPVHSVFPEDEAGLAELARQLEEQQVQQPPPMPHHRAHPMGHHPVTARALSKLDTDSMCASTDRGSSSELDHSDFEDYRRSAFGALNDGASPAVTMSPQSLTYHEFDACPPSAMTTAPADALSNFSGRSPTIPEPAFPAWISNHRPASADFSGLPAFANAGGYLDVDMLNQGLLESNFGTIKPHMLSCLNPEVMMGIGDPMIYSGYDAETLRL